MIFSTLSVAILFFAYCNILLWQGPAYLSQRRMRTWCTHSPDLPVRSGLWSTATADQEDRTSTVTATSVDSRQLSHKLQSHVSTAEAMGINQKPELQKQSQPSLNLTIQHHVNACLT